MDDFLKEFSKLIEEAKVGLLSEIENSDNPKIKKTSFDRKKNIMVRQRLGKTEEEAKAFNLSNKKGIDRTKDDAFDAKRFEKWLIL